MFRVVYPSPYPSREVKSSAQAYCTDGVQLVGVKDDFCFECLRDSRFAFSITVTAHAFCDMRYETIVKNTDPVQYVRYAGGADFSMARFSGCFKFCGSADIVQEGGVFHHVAISILYFCNVARISPYSYGVVPAVTVRHGFHNLPDLFLQHGQFLCLRLYVCHVRSFPPGFGELCPTLIPRLCADGSLPGFCPSPLRLHQDTLFREQPGLGDR